MYVSMFSMAAQQSRRKVHNLTGLITQGVLTLAAESAMLSREKPAHNSCPPFPKCKLRIKNWLNLRRPSHSALRLYSRTCHVLNVWSAGDVVRAPCGVMHGKTSPVFHTNVGVLEGLPKWVTEIVITKGGSQVMDFLQTNTFSCSSRNTSSLLTGLDGSKRVRLWVFCKPIHFPVRSCRNTSSLLTT